MISKVAIISVDLFFSEFFVETELAAKDLLVIRAAGCPFRRVFISIQVGGVGP